MGIGGGIGIAPLHPIAQALKAAGNHTISILGARTRALMIMEDEMRKASDEVILVTDDGTYGKKGFVTDALRELIERGHDDRPGRGHRPAHHDEDGLQAHADPQSEDRSSASTPS